MRSETATLLASGVRKQIRNDQSEAARAIVEYVLAERRGVRLLASTLEMTANTPLPDWFAVANGIRCFTRLRTSGVPGGVLSCARRDNEIRAVNWLRSRLGNGPWMDVRFDLASPLAALRDARRGTKSSLGRAARISRLVRGRHNQLCALRAVELLFYYDRIGRLLDSTGCRVAVMSSYTNPWGIALNLAASRRGIPVVHVMHGTPLTPLPPLDYSLVVVNDTISAETLRAAGCGISRVVVRAGTEGGDVKIQLRRHDLDVLICLSKEPSASHVQEWISVLLASPHVRCVTIRPHPANLWRSLSSALRQFPRAQVKQSSGPLAADLSKCHLVIAGNSSVHLDALAAGIPCIRAAEFDGTPSTALTFVREGLVFEACKPRLELDEVLDFYSRPTWRAHLARYVNFGQTEAEVDAELRSVFELYLGRPSR